MEIAIWVLVAAVILFGYLIYGCLRAIEGQLVAIRAHLSSDLSKIENRIHTIEVDVVGIRNHLRDSG